MAHPPQLDVTHYDAALFDLDGVLTATAARHAECWKRAFDGLFHAHEPFDLERDYVAHVDGKPRHDGALRQANRRADAPAPLRLALELADRSGMLLLARRAREELNAAGARPRRSALSGPGALTPAEHRVAEMATRGHGNREIAERLYVTQRTVETHLTHAFQKLDIGSRAELAAALKRHPPTAEPALTA